ncbi:sulfotransferase 1C4-like [Ixodes scapularis]|uniref:sulfotransferase 1C4-like n=1 Tax=Ixodes scapularis TaxID=6945 RepID=UPI001C38EAFD|nr:sulfotransferase 1C4-like [Ixodes scapularis]
MSDIMEKPVYRDVGGYYVSWGFPETNVRSALNYVPRPGDVFIVGYPKCGNTWLEHIVYNIFNDRAPPKSLIDYLQEMPFLEWQGADAATGMRRPGSIKTHMPFHLQPYSKDAKYICISRNPYDCCVSFYYHTRGKHIFRFTDGTFDEFFEMFLAGKVACGDYFVHLMSWYEHRDDPNVLFLTYEDLKVDAATWVMKIADFLGDDYGKKLRADERALENILSKTNFEAMKEQMNAAHENLFCEMSLMPEDIKPDWVKLSMNAVGDWVPKKNHKSFDFLRKGAVGDWTTHFSDEQVKRLKEHIELKTRGSNVMSLWKTIQLP